MAEAKEKEGKNIEKEKNEEKEEKKKEKVAKKCPVCEEETVVKDYQRGIIICENCGNILKENIKDRGLSGGHLTKSRGRSGVVAEHQ